MEDFVKLRKVLCLTDNHRVSGNKMGKIKVVAVTNFLSDYFVALVIMIFLQHKTHASVYSADSKPYVYSVRV